jgi:signal transduction histidine kinase/CheY-like chemotaxis protein
VTGRVFVIVVGGPVALAALWQLGSGLGLVQPDYRIALFTVGGVILLTVAALRVVSKSVSDGVQPAGRPAGMGLWARTSSGDPRPADAALALCPRAHAKSDMASPGMSPAVGVFADDADRSLQVEAEWGQAQKMEILGQVSGGIAHNFNKVLLAISMNLDSIVEGDASGPGTRSLIAVAQHGVGQAKSLTAQLLAFARRQTLNPTTFEINEAVIGVIQTLRHRIAANIAIETSLGSDLWPARADRRQFEIALLNITLNARDAMPAGGRIYIKTRNYRLQNADISCYPLYFNRDYVEIVVTDNGNGMAPAVLERAFEPFFTTKQSGAGTGLGLSQAYGYVKQSGGHIRITSEPAEGTSVTVSLPRSPEPPADSRRQSKRAHPAGGRERVLMVEDAAIVRGAVKRMLVSLGYDVIDVATGREAIEILEGDAPIDVLFTDMVLPGGIDGGQVAEAARRVRPLIPIVFTSGYTQVRIAELGIGEADTIFLSKPYTKAELAARLRQALGDGRGAE